MAPGRSFVLVIGSMRVASAVGPAAVATRAPQIAPLENEGGWSDTRAVRAADEDDELRAAAFAFLADLVARTGGLVRRHDLRGFSFRGQILSLERNMRGIRFLRGQPALSILTTFRERPEDR